MRFVSVLPLLLALPLAAADWPGPDTLGVQARLALPGANIPDATGSRVPGLGASLLAELHFDSAFCARLELGTDDWRQKGGSGNRSVQDYHLGFEAMYFMQDEGGAYLKGPYLVGGVGLYTWALGSDALGTGVPLRVAKAAATGGFGYRFNAHVDAELKVMASKVAKGFTAEATLVGVTWRF